VTTDIGPLDIFHLVTASVGSKLDQPTNTCRTGSGKYNLLAPRTLGLLTPMSN
jgi:hypothetical protein